MSSIPIQNVAFDDAATSAMGEAFDQACKSLQDFGSATRDHRKPDYCGRQGWRARFRAPLRARIKSLCHRRYVDAGC